CSSTNTRCRMAWCAARSLAERAGWQTMPGGTGRSKPHACAAPAKLVMPGSHRAHHGRSPGDPELGTTPDLDRALYALEPGAGLATRAAGLGLAGVHAALAH